MIVFSAVEGDFTVIVKVLPSSIIPTDLLSCMETAVVALPPVKFAVSFIIGAGVGLDKGSKIGSTYTGFGGVAQLVRACGSYPQSPGFESLHRHQEKGAHPGGVAKRLRRRSAKPLFRGSNPRAASINFLLSGPPFKGPKHMTTRKFS